MDKKPNGCRFDLHDEGPGKEGLQPFLSYRRGIVSLSNDDLGRDWQACIDELGREGRAGDGTERLSRPVRRLLKNRTDEQGRMALDDEREAWKRESQRQRVEESRRHWDAVPRTDRMDAEGRTDVRSGTFPEDF